MRAGRGRWARGAAWCGRGVGRMRGGGVLHRMRAWGAAQDARRHDVSDFLALGNTS